ncbi:MAG TPA: hypothetical protein VHF25_12870 [Nitriliruptorales bacterium]|nr:hypothetical protein [Nitriliruptorales bacterium]
MWYQLTAASDGWLGVDLSEADHSAVAIVATGSPGSWTVLNCAPGAVPFPTEAGQTYTILAFDDQGDGVANGGRLKLTIDEITPPPEIDVTVDPEGTFDPRTGSATIRGTVTCTDEADFAFLETTLTQAVGRFVIPRFRFLRDQL